MEKILTNIGMTLVGFLLVSDLVMSLVKSLINLLK